MAKMPMNYQSILKLKAGFKRYFLSFFVLITCIVIPLGLDWFLSLLMTYGIRHVDGYSDMTSIQFRDWKIGWLKLLTPFSTVFVYGGLISK